jgi:uncharacterized protein (DUF2141 family)
MLIVKLSLVLFINYLLGTGDTQDELIIQIRGISNSNGNIAILLFNQKEGFPSDENKALKQMVTPAVKGVMNIKFDRLKYGTYAVSVIHDENANQKLDTNWIGIPKEGYGFSGNKMGLAGPPSFNDAKISLNKDSQGFVIDMRY